MDQSTRNSERLTAILSTLVALAILAVGVTAQQTRSERPDEVTYLESDLRFQLEAAYRLNPQEGQARLEELESVLAAWRAAPQTEADRRLLSTWLLEATIRSMPGSLEKLPAIPQFGVQEPVNEPSTIPATEPAPASSEPMANNAHLDIVEPPTVPFVPGLTPDLAPPQRPVAEYATPDLAPTHVDHKLVSVTTHEGPANEQPAADPVQINLTELAARIAGYHQGLNELESTLLAEQEPNADQLAAQISILSGLAQDYQFVALYYAALSPKERQAVKEPRSSASVVSTLRQQLDKLQDNANGDFLGEYDADLGQKVDKLRLQLDALADRAEW